MTSTAFRKSKIIEQIQIISKDLAYIEFSENGDGDLRGIPIHHHFMLAECKNLTITNSIGSDDVILTHLNPHQSFGLISSLFLSITTGAQCIVLPGSFQSPLVLFSAVLAHKGLRMMRRANSISSVCCIRGSCWGSNDIVVA